LTLSGSSLWRLAITLKITGFGKFCRFFFPAMESGFAPGWA